jgi:ribosome maturation factor RimP
LSLQSNKELFLLQNPSDLTYESHQAVWGSLNDIMKDYQAQLPSSKRVLGLRIRTWDFAFDEEEGVPVVDIFLDKDDLSQGLNETKVVTFKDCIGFHKYLLNTDFFDIFNDNIEIRIGSLGVPPILGRGKDYKPYVGQMIRVETWSKDVVEGLLKEIIDLEENEFKVLLLSQNSEYKLTHKDIYKAFALN